MSSSIEDILRGSLPSDEIRIGHEDESKKITRYYIFRPMNGTELAEWRRRFSGIGRKPGDSVAANLYAFSKCFLRIDSPIEEEQPSLAVPDLKKRLLDLAGKDGKFAVLLDGIANQFVTRTLPGATAENEFDPKD
jgi:hypothetical protein